MALHKWWLIRIFQPILPHASHSLSSQLRPTLALILAHWAQQWMPAMVPANLADWDFIVTRKPSSSSFSQLRLGWRTRHQDKLVHRMTFIPSWRWESPRGLPWYTAAAAEAENHGRSLARNVNIIAFSSSSLGSGLVGSLRLSLLVVVVVVVVVGVVDSLSQSVSQSVSRQSLWIARESHDNVRRWGRTTKSQGKVFKLISRH